MVVVRFTSPLSLISFQDRCCWFSDWHVPLALDRGHTFVTTSAALRHGRILAVRGCTHWALNLKVLLLQ